MTRRFVLGFLLAVGIGVAGCGGGDDVIVDFDAAGNSDALASDSGIVNQDGFRPDLGADAETPMDAFVPSDMFMPGEIIVSATTLSTSESGDMATFTVVLGTMPNADVSIALSSSDTSEGTVAPASLTFTSVNWNAPQTVTVTGVDDAEIDGAASYTIVTAAAVSTDAAYDGLDASDVSVSNVDDESAGFTVTPTSGLMTTEAGGTDTFTIALVAMPSADVTIDIHSDTLDAATVSPSSVTFTSENWASAQTITVTGVDDSAATGSRLYTILTSPAMSSDPAYDGLEVPDVTGATLDDEMPGVIVTPTSGLATTEGGGFAYFTVVLQSQPSADVMMALSVSDVDEGSVAPNAISFTSSNWNVPQLITVTGVDDPAIDGNQPFLVVVGPCTSADDDYDGNFANEVQVTNNDDETAYFILDPSSGLSTTEAGGTAVFTLVLGAQPASDVTFSLTSSNTAEGTVSPSSVTLTPSHWDTPLSITVTGVDDLVADGAQSFDVVVHISATTDSNYAALADQQVSVTNSDDETPGITVTPTAGLTTSEVGGTATFTIVLNTQPTAPVTIPLASDVPTEGTVAPSSVTFTSTDWNTPQTITVTGVNDAIADGTRVYHIVTLAPTSTDVNYAGLVAEDVTVSNTDNDNVGITVTPTAGLTTTEAGGTATFSVVLASQPMGDVTLALSSSNTAEGTVSPAILTFTSSNWATAQTVTVTGVNDALADGNVMYTIVTGAATSTDLGYDGLDANDVTVTNTDNDMVGITVTPTSGLSTSESGATASFTIVLASQPTTSVSIALVSSNTAEGTVSPSTLTFTSSNWNTPQTAVVVGVDDNVADGNVTFTITTSAAMSADASYNGLSVADVSLSNTNNDTAGVIVAPTSGLSTSEAGGTVSFSIVLSSQPTSNVNISLTSSDVTEGAVSPSSVSFTSASWNIAQTVTVSGIDDSIDDGDIAYTITTGAAMSTDAGYNGLAVSDVAITNIDNDTASVIVTPTTGLVTSEAGGTATFTVVLGAQPSANVTISLTSSNTAEGTVSPASLTFTAANWMTVQTVTVTGVNDAVADGNVAYTVVTGAATSADPVYSGMAVADVAANNTDNDLPGITVNPTAGLTTAEAGGTASFTMVLNSMPTASVSISLSSSDTTEGSVTPASITFTTANWSTPRTVIVTGTDDASDDGDIVYSVVTAAATSTDANYNALNANDVTITNTDDDIASVIVTPTTGLVTTEAGGTATFTVVLTAQPTANVVIALTSSNAAEGTVSPASLTFTPMNWMMTQTAAIAGIDELIDDGDHAYTIVTDVTSSDAVYNGISVSDLAVTNTDNDTAGVTVTPTSGLTTAESGSTASFTVRLTSQPTANVTIALVSSNAGEGTVAPAALTFTAMNWMMPQTVVVTGANDSVADGNVAYSIDTTSTSSDAVYNGITVSDVSVTNADNDMVGITITPTTGLRVSENGTTATFTMMLASQPSANVVINLSSSNTSEGTVSPASLTFTNANWNSTQTVTITGVNDHLFDGNVAFSIVTAAVVSSDANFNGYNPSDVSVTSYTTYSPEAYLKASNTNANDGFGEGVAISGDGNTIAVGAIGEASNAAGINGNQSDNSAAMAGAVYVFTRSGTLWTQQAYIKASNTGADDLFGRALSLSSDGNTLVVGARNEDSGTDGINPMSNSAATDAGAVYVFQRTGTTWAQQAFIKSSNSDAGDSFGRALAVSSDGDTLAVGAVYEASNATGIGGVQTNNASFNSGAVYVFVRAAGEWTQQAYVKASNTGNGDTFGISVALSSDGNTLAVGAAGETSNATGVDGDQSNNTVSGAGAAYLFRRAGMLWSQQAYIKASNTGTGDYFGMSVALSADGNTLAVGASGESSGANGIGGSQTNNGSVSAGAVYVFVYTTAWAQQAYVKASNSDASDDFGEHIALSSDGNTLIVGASYEDGNTTIVDGNQNNSATTSGAAYTYTRIGSTWSVQNYVKATNTGANDFFGVGVGISADGRTVVVGASQEASNATGVGGSQSNNSFANAGAAYVYYTTI